MANKKVIVKGFISNKELAAMTKNNNPDKIKIRSFFMRRLIEQEGSPIKDFVQIGIWDNNYEYLNVDELREFRKFLNETIMKMTFKTTTTK